MSSGGPAGQLLCFCWVIDSYLVATAGAGSQITSNSGPGHYDMQVIKAPSGHGDGEKYKYSCILVA